MSNRIDIFESVTIKIDDREITMTLDDAIAFEANLLRTVSFQLGNTVVIDFGVDMPPLHITTSDAVIVQKMLNLHIYGKNKRKTSNSRKTSNKPSSIEPPAVETATRVRIGK